MTRTLPINPSLEQLKNQAKDLLKAYRAQDSEALHRVEAHITTFSGSSTPALTLARALHVLAHEYGFASWARLKQHIQTRREEETCYLRQQVERLGARDWRVALAANTELVQAGKAGLEAVLHGLSHPLAPVRRACAGFLDHQGTDTCVPAVRQLALRDPVPSVRRAAVHAVGCQRCKPAPLTIDMVAFLLQILASDSSLKVRRETAYSFTLLPPDPRAAAALKAILQEDTDKELRRIAHLALKRQDAEYRKAVDEQARQRGMARAKANSTV